ncbi:hypothetical protein JYQ62_04665 [Nostoc sp. UHCC 0702]|nr:hypothetical protein JYQ62_04665 [Nostoc sp. UHCC 0702]
MEFFGVYTLANDVVYDQLIALLNSIEVNADTFININNILDDKQGLKPIHRIHYMSYSSREFTYLCQGENVNIRYQ